MLPIFYRLLIITSCVLLINTYPLKTSTGQRYLPYDGINDGIFALERFEPNRYPPPSNPYVDMLSKKRQSFGRKHHWDAFFGRR